MGENVIKITGKMGASQTFYVAGDGDYDTLKNIPIINLTGTDEEPILLNTLETGLYRLNGIYRVNASETDKKQAESRLTIVKRVSDNDIYLQMLNPQGNIVEFYHITEADTLHKEVALSNLATVQDIPTKVSELENDSKYITESELKTFGYATEEFVRSQGYLTEETDPTVPDYVKNITEADIRNWNKEYQLPVASPTTLGGIKVGNNLSIDQDGTLNAEKGTQSYAELTNKPKINNVELDGEKSLDDLGIQAKGNYALKNEIPTKTSELNNDSGFLTSIPNDYKTKEENDELYQAKGNYASKEEIPTKTSQLENDSSFITDIPVASTSTLGGIKVGDNLEITADGVLNALGGGDTEVKILSGDYYNPIKLYEITEQGKYLLNGYAKKRETNSSRDNYGENKFVLIVLNVNNTIFQYIVGIFNQQLRLEYRIGTEGSFMERYIASNGDTFEPYNDITIYTGKQIGEYYGNKYQLTTTDKTSLVNAINEINAKISSGTLATNLTEVQGYDATKTQVLKNINGQFTWVDEN